MEKDINTEVSNTQLPATEEKANLKESLRIQKSQWIKEQIKRQREAEDAVLEQMIEEQRVIDGLNSDINENLDRTRESRKFNQEFQEKINTQIYEMNGITEDKLKGMREYKNAYYQGCAFSLFLLSVVMIGICGVLHGFESQICLFMIACTGVEGALLAQDKWRNKLVNILCKLLYLMVFPVMPHWYRGVFSGCAISCRSPLRTTCAFPPRNGFTAAQPGQLRRVRPAVSM